MHRENDRFTKYGGVLILAHYSFNLVVSECNGVLRHMQRYFSYICDGTDVQAD